MSAGCGISTARRAGRDDEPEDPGVDAALCGRTLAKAHAHSGDAIAIASYLGNGDAFDRAPAVFAEAYADQTERDYGALREAVSTGRVVPEPGL